MEVHVKYDKGTMDKLTQANDKVMYAVARRFIDQVGNLHATAYKTGETERSMFTHGVGHDEQGYYVGNFTSYAERVYRLNKANWTNPLTRPHWFENVWKEYGDIIKQECTARYLDD